MERFGTSVIYKGAGVVGNLTQPDGLIHVCSDYPSGNLPLENFWEGAKILVSCYRLSITTYVGDRRAKTTNQINERRTNRWLRQRIAR